MPRTAVEADWRVTVTLSAAVLDPARVADTDTAWLPAASVALDVPSDSVITGVSLSAMVMVAAFTVKLGSVLVPCWARVMVRSPSGLVLPVGLILRPVAEPEACPAEMVTDMGSPDEV